MQIESVNNTVSDRFTPAALDVSVCQAIQILIGSHQLILQSNLSSDTDSDRFTPAAFEIESVNDTDSVRFTPATFEIESVKRY